MKKMYQIPRSTIALMVLVAALAGGLVATWASGNRTVPVFVSSAQAASVNDAVPVATYSPVVKRVTPAVVNVFSTKVTKVRAQRVPEGLFDDPVFRRFFGDQFRGGEPQMPRERRAQALGSGVIVSPDGYILTNNHVVEGATEIKVSFADRTEAPAKLVGTDPDTDVAVLHVDRKQLPVLPLSDSSHVQVGDVVLAVGNPFGIGQTVTMGIVSATGRALGIERFEDFIQTDAAINQGNSGGALVNTRGELIGINTAILPSNGGGNQGIGFAVPVNMARTVMDQLVKSGKVSRGFIGIQLQALDPVVNPELARSFGVNRKGIAITEVQPGSPGAKAGLEVGDVIVAVNGTPAEADVNQFRLRVAGMAAGNRVTLRVVRNGSERDMPVVLGAIPRDRNANGDEEQDEQPGGAPQNGEKGALKGVSVAPLGPQQAHRYQLPEAVHGVIVTDVDPDSPAGKAGLSEGDVIERVNNQAVNSISDFNRLVRSGNGTVLLVYHGGQTKFVVIK